MNKAAVRRRSRSRIGSDLGYTPNTTYCVLDEAGKMNEREVWAVPARNSQPWTESYPGATLVMEAGTHRPGARRLSAGVGFLVIVGRSKKDDDEGEGRLLGD